MLVFKFEIVSPTVKFVDGKEVTVAGLEITMWSCFFKKDDDSGDEVNPTLTAIHKQCDLPLTFTRDEASGLPVDSNGVPISYAGLEVEAKCDSEEYTETNDDGETLKNPLTGQPLRGYRRNVRRIYEP
jgi:hypothetical protein